MFHVACSIQAAYLFGGEAPPQRADNAYGFVFVSLMVSIVTTVPGFYRIYGAYNRYTDVKGEISGRSDEAADVVDKTDVIEDTSSRSASNKRHDVVYNSVEFTA